MGEKSSHRCGRAKREQRMGRKGHAGQKERGLWTCLAQGQQEKRKLFSSQQQKCCFPVSKTAHGDSGRADNAEYFLISAIHNTRRQKEQQKKETRFLFQPDRSQRQGRNDSFLSGPALRTRSGDRRTKKNLLCAFSAQAWWHFSPCRKENSRVKGKCKEKRPSGGRRKIKSNLRIAAEGAALQGEASTRDHPLLLGASLFPLRNLPLHGALGEIQGSLSRVGKKCLCNHKKQPSRSRSGG